MSYKKSKSPTRNQFFMIDEFFLTLVQPFGQYLHLIDKFSSMKTKLVGHSKAVGSVFFFS